MGIFDRWTTRTKEAPVPLQRVTGIGQRHVRPDYTSFQRRVREGYLGNAVVAACVAVRANTLNEAPLVAQNPVTGELLQQHPLTKLFAKPNAYMSQAMFWQTVSTYIDVGGNAYVVKVRNPLGGISELYPYNDGQMVPVLSDLGWVIGYNYDGGDGKTAFFETRDVIHLKSYYIDPLQPHLGLSPIVVASIGIDSYNELMDTLYSVAKNGGVIPGILSSDEALPTPVVDQLKIQFAEKIGGRGEQSGKPLVLSGGISYSEMGQTIAALATPDQFTQYEVAICGAFRVDPAVAMTRAGLLSSTYANKETAFREYTTLTRVPTWNSWEEQVGLSISSEFPGVRLEFDTSDVAALQSDPDSIIYPVIAQFNANLLTVDEARQKMGFGSSADTDRGAMFANDLLAQSAGPAFLEAPQEAMTTEAITDAPAKIDNPNIEPPEPEPPIQYYRHDEKEAGEYWRAADKIMNDYADDFVPFVADGMKTMLQQLTGQKAGELDVTRIKIDELVRQYLNATGKIRGELMREIFYLAVQAAEGNPAEFTSVFDTLTQKTADFQRDQLTTAYGTARDEIGQVIFDNAGKTEAELLSALRGKVDMLSASRAELIAQTVTRATATQTQKDTWEKMNEGKEGTEDEIFRVWVTRRDDKVRPSHREMDGLYVKVAASFPELKADKLGNIVRTGKTIVGPGLTFSGSVGSVARCRCVVRPIRKKKITSGYAPASGAGE
jgi:HK97 family phage portal protein